MKWSFRTTKILFACLVVGYFLPSCNNYKEENEKLEGQLKETLSELNGLVAAHGKRPHLDGDKIYILGYSLYDSSLILQDSIKNDATEVVCERKQIISWITSNTHIKIINIDSDPIWIDNDPNFFSLKPTQDKNPQNWTATLRDLPNQQGSSVHYYIKWRLDTDSPGTTYTYDPLMQLNPIK